jgi:Flp pilus assembly protein TadD
MTLSDVYTRHALTLAYDTADNSAIGMGQLARARFWQARDGRAGRAIATIEEVAERAQASHDVALLAQAYAALGEAKARRGEMDEARNLHRRAADIFLEHDLYAMSRQSLAVLGSDHNGGAGGRWR